MDLAAQDLTLAGGLDIQGKLVFPDGYQLTLAAPFIRVQGKLHMTSTKIPNGVEDVKFLLTGTDETLTKFTPHDNNAMACDGECSVGKKPIVVAGGELEIQALPENTTTWLPLYDIATDSAAETLAPDAYDSYQAPPGMDGCNNSTGVYIPDVSALMGSLGANVNYVDGRLLVQNRTSSRYILHVDLKDFRHCLSSSRTYLLTARFKLIKPGAPTLTEVRQS